MSTMMEQDVINYDVLARTCILELKNGKIPDWPECGFGDFWEPIIAEIERYSRKCKQNAGLVTGKIESMYGQYPELKKLLAPRVPVQGGIPQQEALPVCPPLPDHLQYPPELAGSACKWLDDYIAFSKKWSPRAHESYHECIAMALLATIAGRRVSLSYGDMEYTPLFIALVGPTTLFSKSTTLKLYNGLLHAAGLDWMLGANIITPQKLLSNMSGHTLPANWDELDQEQQTRVKKRLAMAAQVGWCYDEFGMQLDAMVKENGTMAEFKGLLRLLHDCKPVFEYDTHRRGLERIEKPYLSLVASLTISDIKPYAEKGNKFYRDGLFARFLFSCPAKGTKSKRDQFPNEKLIYPPELTMPLVRWHQWLGEPEIEIDEQLGKDNQTVIKRIIRVVRELPEQECVLPNDVREHIIAYENALKDMMEAEPLPLVPDDLFGSYGRFHMQALHICMLLASIDNQGYIELRHWARARQFIEDRRKELHEMYLQTNVQTDEASYEDKEGKLEDEILQKMTELADKGNEWVTASVLYAYMKKSSREKIENKLKGLAKQGILEMEQSKRAAKFRISYEE